MPLNNSKDDKTNVRNLINFINELEAKIKALETALANTQMVYVADTSGGAVTTEITVVKK